MAKITVKAKIDGGIHLKHGEIVKGREYEIEDTDFGDQLFERPPGFESPHERASRERQEAAAKAIAEASQPEPQPEPEVKRAGVLIQPEPQPQPEAVPESAVKEGGE